MDATGIEPVTPCLQSPAIASNSSFRFSLTTNVSNESGNLLSLKANSNLSKTIHSGTVRAEDHF